MRERRASQTDPAPSTPTRTSKSRVHPTSSLATMNQERGARKNPATKATTVAINEKPARLPMIRPPSPAIRSLRRPDLGAQQVVERLAAADQLRLAVADQHHRRPQRGVVVARHRQGGSPRRRPCQGVPPPPPPARQAAALPRRYGRPRPPPG